MNTTVRASGCRVILKKLLSVGGNESCDVGHSGCWMSEAFEQPCLRDIAISEVMIASRDRTVFSLG